MPDISEYLTSRGTLKAADLDGDTEVTIEAYRHKIWDDGNVTHYIKLSGFDVDMRVNKTNLLRISEKFGSKTEDWIGKKITIFPDETKNPQGQTVPTILVKKGGGKRPTPTRQSENPAEGMDDEVPF